MELMSHRERESFALLVSVCEGMDLEIHRVANYVKGPAAIRNVANLCKIDPRLIENEFGRNVASFAVTGRTTYFTYQLFIIRDAKDRHYLIGVKWWRASSGNEKSEIGPLTALLQRDLKKELVRIGVDPRYFHYVTI